MSSPLVPSVSRPVSLERSSSERENRNVTLKDVAAYAGVSAICASGVLNGGATPRRVSEETRSKIVSAAEELGYKRNAGAAQMRSKRFGMISLLLATDPNQSNLPHELLDGIQDGLVENDLQLLVSRVPDERLCDEGFVPRILREWMADGLLIDYTQRYPQRMTELIREHHLPAVWINTRQSADCVYPDERSAGKRAAAHLLEQGHRRIAYCNFTSAPDAQAHYSVFERLQGLRETTQSAGVSLQVMEQIVAPNERVGQVRTLLQSAARPSAIVTYDATNGVADAVRLAAALEGLDVPRDLSILSFASLGHTCCGAPLSCLVVPEREVGRQAVAMLKRKIQHPERVLHPQLVSFEFQAGQTCAPPRRTA